MAHGRRYSFKALAGGLFAYALAKLVAIGVAASATIGALVQNPQLFLPVAASQLLSEAIGAGIALAVLWLFRFAAGAIFLGVAAIQLAIVWLHGFGLKQAGLGWMMGNSGMEKVWDWLGRPPPYAEPTAMGGLTLPAIVACVAAGLVAQALHNAVVRDRTIRN